MSKVKFDCRISKELKNSLTKKASEAGLTDSEFIRIMLNEEFDITKLINNYKNDNIELSSKIRCRILEYKYNELESLCNQNNITISLLIRLLIKVDDYEVNKNKYLHICEYELIRSGKKLNEIAYELNKKNLSSNIHENDYNIVIARLIEPFLIANNIQTLLKNPPHITSTEVKTLYNKTTQLSWASHIYRITNNVRQIFTRCLSDFNDNIISINLYNEIVKALHSLIQIYENIFIYLKIFNKIIIGIDKDTYVN